MPEAPMSMAAGPIVATTPVVPSGGAASGGGGGTNLRMTNDVRVYEMVKDAVVNIPSSKRCDGRVSDGE